ncbi:hypothetical protein BDV95DRAFT_598573 [Massariosphaeria phaeospora]|uniref:Uncharacterized protein n=1 Tax=Massariosphaeria phaeospora TaxID=100035 RepID=A0A7C8MGP3_9PLEO|nr:hypothetical protein BDV95DRAFT_598573 [Massariosphaeria phaeospora]
MDPDYATRLRSTTASARASLIATNLSHKKAFKLAAGPNPSLPEAFAAVHRTSAQFEESVSAYSRRNPRTDGARARPTARAARYAALRRRRVCEPPIRRRDFGASEGGGCGDGLRGQCPREVVQGDVFRVGITREEVMRTADLFIWIDGCKDEPEVRWNGIKDEVLQEMESGMEALLHIPFERRRDIVFHFDADGTRDWQIPVLSHMLKIVSPAFLGLKEKGFDLVFYYQNNYQEIVFELDSEAFEWTFEEWMSTLRRTGADGTACWLVQCGLVRSQTEAEIQRKMPTWKTIMRDLYRVPMEEGDE